VNGRGCGYAYGMTCYFYAATDDLRTCERCHAPTYRAHADAWPMCAQAVKMGVCKCRPCGHAETLRLIAEGRTIAGDVEMAPSFEDHGLKGRSRIKVRVRNISNGKA
jgi:hypothetical protein